MSASAGSAQAVRVGIHLPTAGDRPLRHGVAAMARRAEAGGADGLWASDHVVMTRTGDRSRYPFADDGRMTWDVEADWFDCLVALSVAAGVTERIRLGTAVLVLPLRHPVVLAKQVASLDVLSGGRVDLGIGVGWYVEEMEALGVDPAERGVAFDEAVELLRRLWTGAPEAFDGRIHQLPSGVVHRPTPLGRLPLLVGGVSDVALRRAARQGDGWLGLVAADRLDPAALASTTRRLSAAATEVGRDPTDLRVVLRVIASAGRAAAVAPHIPALAAAGVDEVVVDVDWDHDDVADVVASLRP